MSKKQPKPKEKKAEKPRVHKELEGFDIEINSFGEIKNSFDIDKINAFLNKNVSDKKLRDRDDIEEIKRRGNPPEDEKQEESE